MQELVVVGIGPDDADMLTLGAADALKNASAVLMRTEKHGVAYWLQEQGIQYKTLDALYDGADDFDAFAQAAIVAISTLLAEKGSLCYAVPDPATDATVKCLKAQGYALKVIPGVTQSVAISAKALETVLPVADDYCTVTAMDFSACMVEPSMPLIVTELNSRLMAGEVKIGLLETYPPEKLVLVNGAVVPLGDMDRQGAYNHLSTVFVPESPMAERNRYTFGDLLTVMEMLRDPESGCPWDKEQTHETLRQYLIEEAHEAVDAINQDDVEKIADELGDVMLQVVFHAQVGKEHGTFSIGDVTTAICHKMITRHVHIFGDVVCETSDDVVKSWEAIKQKEKGLKATTDIMKDVPGYLPALMRASKVQGKARQVGFDWDTPDEALAKVTEETAEVAADIKAGKNPEMEFGDLLFAVVNAARLAGVQPEVALGSATEKFIRRFSTMEKAIFADGKQLKGMTLPEMDKYWDAVKRDEKENV